MRVIFMGTPDFAVPALKALTVAGHEVVAAYTQPPRPGGRRGKELTPTPVHKAAEELGIPASAVQQAAAEERLGVLEGSDRRTDRLVGPGVVTAVRIVDGRRSDVLAHTDEWLRRAAFRRRRFSPSFAEYARRGDPVAVAQRAGPARPRRHVERRRRPRRAARVEMAARAVERVAGVLRR